jgi:RNA polymerase sigma-54 factor
MSPQLQQAMKLLQCNQLEMAEMLEQELKENPLLEITPEQEALRNEDSPLRNDIDSLEDLTREPDIRREFPMDIDWRSYMESYGGDYSPAGRDSFDPPGPENLSVTANGATLFQHLLEQIRLGDFDDHEKRIALEIIGNLDDSGYLDATLEELAQPLGVTTDEVERVLAKVRCLDPRGVASRNVRECLLTQAGELDPPAPLVIEVLERRFDDLMSWKLEKIARELKVSLDQVREVAAVVSALDPRPGRAFAHGPAHYVVPDIFVYKDGDDYTVVLNDSGMPRLRISPYYQRGLHNEFSDKAVKDYVQEKMRGAVWFMKSIDQRKRTIQKVAASIVNFQREFFDKGIAYLKPLVLRDVAADVEMHESTVSRATSNKYMHTPRGIFELKFFFDSGLPHGAEFVSSESVKSRILDIIRNENPGKPVSDKKIAELLAAQGIEIARRTVAKYRELCGIPPSAQRKTKF